MLPSAMLMPVSNSAHLISNTVGGCIGIVAVDNASTDGTATVLGGLAMRVRVWLMQMEEPGSPLRGAMMRYIRSAAPALGWLRFAQATKRFDFVAAFLPNV